jgi:hypothetical protein
MSASSGLFGRYPNRIFVETGSQEGFAIQQALDEGFKVAHSIEIEPSYYAKVWHRFKDNPNVHLFLGDSGVMLEVIMRLIDEPVTFWLDAHVGAESTPIMKELEIIKNHHIKTHSILIDDLRDWKTHVNGVNVEMFKEKLLEINPDYTLVLDAGRFPKDVLVAYIK